MQRPISHLENTRPRPVAAEAEWQSSTIGRRWKPRASATRSGSVNSIDIDQFWNEGPPQQAGSRETKLEAANLYIRNALEYSSKRKLLNPSLDFSPPSSQRSLNLNSSLSSGDLGSSSRSEAFDNNSSISDEISMLQMSPEQPQAARRLKRSQWYQRMLKRRPSRGKIFMDNDDSYC